MDHIKIITTGTINIRIRDEKGNIFTQKLTETFLSNLLKNMKITLKNSTTLKSYQFRRKTLFQVTVDVIDALLDDDVDGVILLCEKHMMDEFSFYLSLFTTRYKKPIIFYSLAEEYQVKYDQAHLPCQYPILTQLRSALNIVSNHNYYMLGPLTVIDRHLCLAVSKQIKIAELTNRLLLTTPPQFIRKLYKVSTLIGHLPVIPEKVAHIQVSLGMEGKEILNIIKHYAGGVIEVSSLQAVHPSVVEAIHQLINYRIPILIVETDHSQSFVHKEDSITARIVRTLPSKFARLLLGVMIAQKVQPQIKKQVYKIFR